MSLYIHGFSPEPGISLDDVKILNFKPSWFESGEGGGGTIEEDYLRGLSQKLVGYDHIRALETALNKDGISNSSRTSGTII